MGAVGGASQGGGQDRCCESLFPVSTDLGGEDGLFVHDTIEDLGTYWEFVDEFDYQKDGPVVWRSSDGKRLRIIIDVLEVLYIRQVPESYDPDQLRVYSVEVPAGEIWVELIGDEITRTIHRNRRGRVTAVSPLTWCGAPEVVAERDGAMVDPSEFNRIWVAHRRAQL